MLPIYTLIIHFCTSHIIHIKTTFLFIKAECLTIEPGTALNPAFLKSSGDQFENFEARGEDFRFAVEQLV